MNIKEMVKNKKVHFVFYREKELYYKTDDGFVFPVPIEDIGNATFLAEDKAILFMRYIRKYLEKLAEEKRERDANSKQKS
jgi:hypothetical protein